MPQIAFITIFLAVVSGVQPVEFRVGPDVKRVRVQLAGRQVALIRQAPWVAYVNLGTELVPVQLTAIGLDSENREVGRATQFLNMNRPTGEVDIVLSDSNQEATLEGRHRLAKRVKRATLSLDGVPLSLDRRLHTAIPKLDRSRTHWLSAEMRFEDGFTARRDVIIGGETSYSSTTELAPMLVRETGGNINAAKRLEECFSANGKVLDANGVEKPEAVLVMVKEPDARPLTERLRRMVAPEVGVVATPRRFEIQAKSDRWWEPGHHEPKFEAGTLERIQWPTAEMVGSGEGATRSFPSSGDYDSAKHGLYWLLTRGSMPDREPYAVADAVAVAAVNIPARSRRAVILVVGGKADQSEYSPAIVRRYLERLRVPLFVWSMTGPRADLADTWGAVDDISALPKLLKAFERVRAELEAQRVVWVDTDPATALKAEADARCGFSPVVEPQPAPSAE